MIKPDRGTRRDMKKPGKSSPEKRAYNVYMETDLADYLRDRFPNMGARIMTELSRKFKEETEKDPGFAMDVVDGEFGLVSTRRRKNKA